MLSMQRHTKYLEEDGVRLPPSTAPLVVHGGLMGIPVTGAACAHWLVGAAITSSN